MVMFVLAQSSVLGSYNPLFDVNVTDLSVSTMLILEITLFSEYDHGSMRGHQLSYDEEDGAFRDDCFCWPYFSKTKCDFVVFSHILKNI